MRATTILFVTIAALSGCAASSSNNSPSPGRFVMAGPTNAIASQLSMRWQYGLLLAIEPQSISEIQFSCQPIPGTSFSAKSTELRRTSDGALFIEGPVLLVSREVTPWMFENSTTTAQCKASISRPGQPDAVVSATVNFNVAMKAETLLQLETAQRFNAPAKK